MSLLVRFCVFLASIASVNAQVEPGKLARTTVIGAIITEDNSGKHKVGQRVMLYYSTDGRTSGINEGTFIVRQMTPTEWTFEETFTDRQSNKENSTVTFSFPTLTREGKGERKTVVKGRLLVIKFDCVLYEGDTPEQMQQTIKNQQPEVIDNTDPESLTYEEVLRKFEFSDQEKLLISSIDLNKRYWVASEGIYTSISIRANNDIIDAYLKVNPSAIVAKIKDKPFIGIASGRRCVLNLVRSKQDSNLDKRQSQLREEYYSLLERKFLNEEVPISDLIGQRALSGLIIMRKTLASSAELNEKSPSKIEQMRTALEAKLASRDYILDPILDDSDYDLLTRAICRSDYKPNQFIASTANVSGILTPRQRWTLRADRIALKYIAPTKLDSVKRKTTGVELIIPSVTVTSGFWISTTPVTRKQFYSLMGFDPSRYAKVEKAKRLYLGDAHYKDATVGSPGGAVRYIEETSVNIQSVLESPVESVSKQEAQDFCIALTKRETSNGSIPIDFEYRLPTSAEWSVTAYLASTKSGKIDGFEPMPEVFGPVYVLTMADTVGIAAGLFEYCAGSYDPNLNTSFNASSSPFFYPNSQNAETPSGPKKDHGVIMKSVDNELFGMTAEQDYVGVQDRRSDIGFRIVLASVTSRPIAQDPSQHNIADNFVKENAQPIEALPVPSTPFAVATQDTLKVSSSRVEQDQSIPNNDSARNDGPPTNPIATLLAPRIMELMKIHNTALLKNPYFGSEMGNLQLYARGVDRAKDEKSLERSKKMFSNQAAKIVKELSIAPDPNLRSLATEISKL